MLRLLLGQETSHCKNCDGSRETGSRVTEIQPGGMKTYTQVLPIRMSSRTSTETDWAKTVSRIRKFLDNI